jgi:hypothetical protein
MANKQRHPLRVNIEDFPRYLEKELTLKFATVGGLQGLNDRFQALMTLFKDIMQETIEINQLVRSTIRRLLFIQVATLKH